MKNVCKIAVFYVFTLVLLYAMVACNADLIGEAPDAPSGVTATLTSADTITIIWNPVRNADGYHIYRNDIQHDSISSTSYEDTGLSPNTSYKYGIVAYNSGGTSTPSPSSTVRTAPGAPTGVRATATAGAAGSITISWNSMPGANRYYIYRSSSESGAFNEITNITDTIYINTGLTVNTTYYYRIAASGSSGRSEQSNTVSATANPNVPSAPQNVSVKLSARTSVTLSWSPVTGATGYRIYRRDSWWENEKLIGTSTTPSYTDSASLVAGNNYWYKVSAYNVTGESSLQSYAQTVIIPYAASYGLTRNVFRDFYLDAGAEHTFTVNLTSGTWYIEWIDVDKPYPHDESFYADVKVGVRRGTTNVVAVQDNGNSGDNYHRFTVTSANAGNHTIIVQGLSDISSGPYTIIYYNNSDPSPSNPW